MNCKCQLVLNVNKLQDAYFVQIIIEARALEYKEITHIVSSSPLYYNIEKAKKGISNSQQMKGMTGYN